VNWHIGQKFNVGIDGRKAFDNDVAHEEATVHINYAL